MTGSVARSRGWTALLVAATVLSACGAVGAQPLPGRAADGGGGAGPAVPAGVVETGPIAYMHDRVSAATCDGARTSELTYVVFHPTSPGPHPVVFGMAGTGFAGAAGCDPATGRPVYRGLDGVMAQWAAAGFVAVNIGYHGFANGLYGDLSYPGTTWGATADATVELNIKPAVRHFLGHDPGRFGADPAAGLVAFGGSSGAHNAYMLAATGVAGVRFVAAIGWSGFPDEADAGGYARHILLTYMRAPAGSDLAEFGDPMHRIGATSPAQYIANATADSIAPGNAIAYWERCRTLRIRACWLREPTSRAHAEAYADYRFTGSPPERSTPPTMVGSTVLADSIAFARSLTGAVAPGAGALWSGHT